MACGGTGPVGSDEGDVACRNRSAHAAKMDAATAIRRNSMGVDIPIYSLAAEQIDAGSS
jgi:hypothetical protein